jgi:WD40 repeat protein
MINRSFALTIVALLLVLIGCNPIPTPLVSATVSPTVVPYTQPHINVTATLPVTSTPTLATPSPTQTPSPRPIITRTPTATRINWEAVPACQGESQTVSEVDNFGLGGVIAYYDAEQNGFYTFGGFPSLYTQLPISGTIHTKLVGFSPNGEWLAYELDSPTIGLLSSKGEEIVKTIDIKGFYSQLPEGSELCGWNTNPEWINNDLIDLSLCYRESAPQVIMKNYDLFAVLDPFSGTWREDFLSDLPERLEFSHAVFSPDMDRVLYVNKDHTLVLWNLVKQSSIHIKQPFDFKTLYYADDPLLVWSPNSNLAAIAAPEDELQLIPDTWQRGVYLLGREGGKGQKITNFLAEFDSFTSYGLRWSPDSRYLAFSVAHTNGEEDRQTLYVYDLEAGNYIFQCDLDLADPIRFYWSPDNQFIAYTYYYASPLVVISLNTGETYIVTDRAIIGGWSDQFTNDRNSR